MITAKEAQGLVAVFNSNKAKIAKVMEQLEAEIKAAAKQGFQEIFWTNDYEATSSIESYRVHHACPTEMQQLVIDELRSNGFAASLEQHGEPYVPRGLSNDFGEGPEYVSMAVKVSWYKKD